MNDLGKGDIYNINQNDKVDFAACAKYSFGGIGFSMTNMIVLSYLAFFCTDIFGISPLTVAGLMLATKVIDAVTDPLMGFIADRTRTRQGRYRPYLIFGAPVLGILIYMLFSAPNLPAAMKVVFIYITYIGYSLAFTAVGIPFIALVAVMAKGTQQRTTIVSWKNIMIQVGRMFITTFSLPLVEAFGGGTIGWGRYGALVGGIITLCFWIVAWGAKPYDIMEAGIKTKRQKVNINSELRLITKNKPLIMLMIAFGTDMVANSALLAANMYYFKYVLGRQDLVPVVAMALTITGVAANIMLPFFSKKFSKKSLYWFGSFLSIIPLAVLWIRPVVPVSVLLLLMTSFGFISALPSALAWVMLPDCIDYSQYISGVEGKAVVSSTFSFMNKIGGALGAFLASFLMGIIGFVANKEQAPGVLSMIVFLRFGLPILGYLISLVSMYFYELTEDRHMEICQALAERAVEKSHNQED